MKGPSFWARFSADPRDPAARALRATDGDRDEALAFLREAFADGRLTRAEHDERAATVLTARALGDLIPVLDDLVVTVPQSLSPATKIHHEAVKKYQRDLRDARNGFLSISGLTLSIWGATSLASGGLLFFWPVFPIIAVGLGFVQMWLGRESRIESIEDKLAARRRKRRGTD